MSTYPFLSDDWVSEARRIREEYDSGATVPHQVKMNLVITEVPFGDGAIDAHLDTTEGHLKLETGHIDPADLKVTLDYATAKAILVEGNPQVGMQAFMAGKVKVEGDMAQLMMLQGAAPDENAQDVAKRLCVAQAAHMSGVQQIENSIGPDDFFAVLTPLRAHSRQLVHCVKFGKGLHLTQLSCMLCVKLRT